MKTKTLERAMEFIACPRENARLREFDIRAGRNGIISSGGLRCDSCGEKYPIRNGVPSFYDGRDAKPASSVEEGRRALRDSLEERDEKGCIYALSSIAANLLGGPSFSAQPASRVSAIKYLEALVGEFDRDGLTEEKSLILRQAFNAVRYDLEDYRGTFVVPRGVLSELSVRKGLVFEAGCATGENLRAAGEFFGQQPFYIGLDISESLIQEAERRFGSTNTLFVQGNVTSLPIAGSSTSLFMANNIWDRVGSPRTAAAEARRILAERGVIEVGNCTPLQYESPGGDRGGKVVYVPESQRASLREIIELAGARLERSVRDLQWNISTLLYGAETLSVDLEIGRRVM